MTWTPWLIFRRVSGEASVHVDTVNARSEKEAMSRYVQRHGHLKGEWGRTVEYVARPAKCEECDGTGIEPGTLTHDCTECNGYGHLIPGSCTHCGWPAESARDEWARQCHMASEHRADIASELSRLRTVAMRAIAAADARDSNDLTSQQAFVDSFDELRAALTSPVTTPATTPGNAGAGLGRAT